jgi:transcriptional activator SPT7
MHDVQQDITDLWWQAVRSDTLLGNGLPRIQYSSSRPPASLSYKPPTKNKVRKQKQKEIKPSPRSLLTLMNNNIRTMRRVRRTHAKFAALNANDEGDVASLGVPTEEEVNDVVDERPWDVRGSGVDMGAKHADDCLHWMGWKILEHAGFQGLLFLSFGSCVYLNLTTMLQELPKQHLTF